MLAEVTFLHILHNEVVQYMQRAVNPADEAPRNVKRLHNSS